MTGRPTFHPLSKQIVPNPTAAVAAVQFSRNLFKAPIPTDCRPESAPATLGPLVRPPAGIERPQYRRLIRRGGQGPDENPLAIGTCRPDC
ncbi:Hypothetical protein NTJ_11060 [Nesidiocoris tenuis]|uniref:Uncharacterized protein n=1 Tax=Nesidiocoris tenuis TaxID=355587 RepID=A0ABN7B1F5_9HEMI|nr:Hypothetical protein NTJ_11060 [Nesidiocoris tenuis]